MSVVRLICFILAMGQVSCVAMGVETGPEAPSRWFEYPMSCRVPQPTDGLARFSEVTPLSGGSCGDLVPSSGLATRIGVNFAIVGDSMPCGTCVEFQSAMGSVSGVITDNCPGCREGEFDLPSEFAESLGSDSHSALPLQWRTVPCEPSGGISLNLLGSTPSYFHLVVSGSRMPIASVSLVERLGERPLRYYRLANFWELSDGLEHGNGPYTFRITDVLGRSLDIVGVSLPLEGNRLGAYTTYQFESCE